MIITDEQIHIAVNDGLEACSAAEVKTHIHPCYHCGCPIRYPAMVRKQDLDNFALIMKSADAVLRRNGVTALLLAELSAQIHIELARRKSKE